MRQPPPTKPRLTELLARRLPGWDAVCLLGVCVLAFLLLQDHDGFALLRRLALAHPETGAAELLDAAPLAVPALLAFGWRRARALRREGTRRVAAEAEAARLALHDPLTGLANRRLLAMASAAAIAEARRGERTTTLLVVDFGGFKAVNDLLGHAGGDDFLLAATERLRGLVRRDATVARLGGDEFGVLSLVDGPAAAGWLAARVVRQLGDVFSLGGRQMRVTVSVGIALHRAGEGGSDRSWAELLLHRADIAMSRIKAQGRGGYMFFEAGMDEAEARRARTEVELRQGLARGEIEPHFQPLVSLPTGRLLGFEALARWRHPDRGLLPPSEFIDLAESSGLIEPLGLALLRAACLEARSWPGRLTLAVNLSAVQLGDRDLALRILIILDDVGFDPRRLELEVTETAVAAQLETARASMLLLKAHGVRIALDDFGTGHASLLSLRSLPFDKIKIDRTFVGRIEESAESAKIVAAIVGLGQSLGLATTAEGIENAACARRMVEMGCQYGQGYLYGRPLPPPEARHRATQSAEPPAGTLADPVAA